MEMINNGWIDWADKSVRGLDSKRYQEVNQSKGIVWHSAEGWKTTFFSYLTDSSQKSWMFTISVEGILYQHYPVTASCWASGNAWANTSFWSVELEGVHTQPINQVQLNTALKLIEEWSKFTGQKPVRTGNINSQNMHLHREVATAIVPNAGATACPSQRYDAMWPMLNRAVDDLVVEQTDPSFSELNEALLKRFAIAEYAAVLNRIAFGHYDKVIPTYDNLKKLGLI